MTAERIKLVENNIALAKSLIKRYEGKGIEYDDLYQAACLGLTKAAGNFDQTRGLKFSTYAVPVILGEMKQLFRRAGSIKVSRSLKELGLKAKKANDEYFAVHSYAPKISELAEILGESVERVSDALCATELTLSIDEQLEINHAADISSSFEEELLELVALRSAISKLTKEEAALLRERYLMNKTQQKTAKQLGMTQVQVSRRERKVLNKLRTLIVEKE